MPGDEVYRGNTSSRSEDHWAQESGSSSGDQQASPREAWQKARSSGTRCAFEADWEA